jgi:multiple sugar transport system ATP-binding protein
MASITLDDVSKVFADGTKAVRDFDLHVTDGEFVILVGPSGSGKSTALRMIAGLEEVSSGVIKIGDRVVNDVEPKDRDLAMVFQSYALYPHMSVEANMGFALKMQGQEKPRIAERVGGVAEMIGVRELLHRRPRQLSGGQRQRVALGRAIVREPAAFLMDEPLSNLDAKLRVEMRTYIGRLHQELGTTTVYVTHDQVEAMTMGDRVAVMRDGRISQVDTPQALYDSPANLFVAGFIGSPAMNLVRGRIERRDDGGLDLVLGSQRISVSTRTELVGYEGREVVAGFRPEQFDVSYNGHGAGRELVLNVLLTEALGSDMLAYLELDAPPVEGTDLLAVPDEHTPITARLAPGTQIRAGERVTLLVEPDRMHFFDPDTELAIT